MAFGLGMRINFSAIIQGGLAGIALGVLTVLLTGTTFLGFQKGRVESNCRCAEGAVAGNAIATPAAIAAVSASFASQAELATVQIAAACVTSGYSLTYLYRFSSKEIREEESNHKNRN